MENQLEDVPEAQRKAEVDKMYIDKFEKPVADLVSGRNFPKEGPNNKVSELDLRVWETLFIESLKILNKWE